MELSLTNETSMAHSLEPPVLLACLYCGKCGVHCPINVAYYDCKESNASLGRLGLVKAATKSKEVLPPQIRNNCIARVPEDNWCSNKKLRLRSSIRPATWEHIHVSVLFNDTRTG